AASRGREYQDDRGHRRGRQAACGAGSFRAPWRSAVRDVYARNDPGCREFTGADPSSHRVRDPQRSGRQPVPLHRVHEDFRSGRESLRIMRANVPAYELIAPRTLEAALSLLGETWKPFAGGTDLMVLFEAGKLTHKKFVSLWGLAELRGIEVSPDHVTMGALTTYTEIQRHPVLRSEFPLLPRAA